MTNSKTEREKRLAEALRANLRKRKGLDEVPPANDTAEKAQEKTGV